MFLKAAANIRLFLSPASPQPIFFKVFLSLWNKGLKMWFLEGIFLDFFETLSGIKTADRVDNERARTGNLVVSPLAGGAASFKALPHKAL
ncbi:hypothetical protein [Salinimicrobium flavum]|uniref:Uncharacterized protein n=1 Tax=Salinimicrobium flavum TaxID=1737065 RepID=A0ABW5IW04_9FLAO